jgi:hypothetical protein
LFEKHKFKVGPFENKAFKKIYTPTRGKVGEICGYLMPFEKFGDSPHYCESELCGGAVTVSLSKYLPWQAMLFLQRFTHFSKM